MSTFEALQQSSRLLGKNEPNKKIARQEKIEITAGPQHTPTEISFQNATRIQTSLTAAAEKRILLWLAPRIPANINSDHLTLLGLISMFLAGTSYALARYSSLGLLGATICLFTNWFGDSLDGTLARFRNQQRPRYGFYVDHLIDSLGAVFLMTGLAASTYIEWRVATALLVAFLLLSIESYLATYTLGIFRLSHAKLGPTEIRILLALANLLLYVRPQSAYANVAHHPYRLFDVAGTLATVIMAIMLIASSIAPTITLYRQETQPASSS